MASPNAFAIDRRGTSRHLLHVTTIVLAACSTIAAKKTPTIRPTSRTPTMPTGASPLFLSAASAPLKSLLMEGDNGSPSTAFPLPACSGDCDTSQECFGDLLCYQRSGTEAVPGCSGTGTSAKDYCYKPNGENALAYTGDNGKPARSFPLGICEGDCDTNADCALGLACFQRTAFEAVPGCSGTGVSGVDYCYSATTTTTPTRAPTSAPLATAKPVVSTAKPTPNPVQVPTTQPTKAPTAVQVLTTQPTKAPTAVQVLTTQPTQSPTVQVTAPPTLKTLLMEGDNGSPSAAFPLPACSGDCDTSQECFGDLLCYQRSGTEAVPGCSGTGTSAKDYCYKPNGENALAYTGDNGKPARSFPLGICEGDCDTNADCAPGLACFQRGGSEAVPGCSGAGVSGISYCYSATPTLPPTLAPGTASPTASSTASPTTSVGPTYVPGDLTVVKLGLRLSTGLDVRKIATEGQPVQYANGQQSSVNLHMNPDGAAVFLKNDNSGNYFYVSNSEIVGSGGVGSIEFDSNGNVVGYKRVLSGTNNNCSGGRSPYNTWLSCEEYGTSGFAWEVSPEGAFVGRKTNLVPYGGNFESVAYDFDPSLGRHVYYITEDASTGALIQFTPSANLGTREEMYSTGTHRYLRVDSGNSGTFSWVSTKAQATPSLYPNTEGIDIKDGVLYFVSKVDKTLFILQLRQGTFTKESTNQGAFNNQPDQVGRLIGSDPGNILYFCEDGGTYCGVHGRDPTGKYVTIIDNDPATTTFTGETTGLAFSPDGKRMYVSFQTPGIIFEFSRLDGLSFGGALLDIKYHASDPSAYWS